MSCPSVELEPGQVWTDWLHEQRTTAGRLRPRCREALVRWLAARPDIGRLRVKAVGAGHSTSGVARPRGGAGVFVDLGALQLEPEEQAAAARWIRPGATSAGEHLVRVAAGTTIAALNQMLAASGRALPNMGSYDAQTVVGAVSTGTHGTGLATGPLCDFVASLEMVTVLPRRGVPTVVTLRLEPADGPTDPARFDGGPFGIELVRDTEAFDAAVVGLGCFGIVTAVTLRVVDAFWLEETRRLWTWPELAAGRTLLDQVERDPWVDLVMTPLPRPGHGGSSHRVLVTTRRRIPVPPGVPPPPRQDYRVEKLRKRAEEHADAADPRLALTLALAKMASKNPRFANRSTSETLEKEAEAPPLRSASHVVLRTSVADWTCATSAEVAVPLERTVEAVDATIDHLRAMHELGYHHVSPVGIRFGRASRHLLSQHYGRRTCTIEAPILIGARRDGHPEEQSAADIDFMLGAFVRRLTDDAPGLDARVHWGQRHVPAPRLQRMYPGFARWLAQMRRFNPYGIFGNAHTDSWTAADPALGETWSAWQDLGGILTSPPAAALEEDGRIQVFGRGTDHHLWRIAQGTSGAWTGWTALDAGLDARHHFGQSLALAVEEGRLHVMAYYREGERIGRAIQGEPGGSEWRWDLGSSFGQLIGGAEDAVCATEQLRGGRRLITLAARRTNGRIHARTPAAGNGDELGNDEQRFVGTPALVRNHDGRLSVVGRDRQGRVFHLAEDAHDRWAPRWEAASPAGAVSGDVAAALGADDLVRLLARGPSGELVQAVQRERGASAFGPWQSLGGTLFAEARPVVVRTARAGLQVFVRWQDGSIRCRRQRDGSGAWGDWESLGGIAVFDPCVVAGADGALVVFHVGREGHLHWSRQSGDRR